MVSFQNGTRRAALVVVRHIDLVGVEPRATPRVILPIERVVQDHALGEQVAKWLIEPDQTKVAHHPGPEPGVKQVQDGVLDPADVLVHRHPVIIAGINHGTTCVGRAVAHEVPGRVDKCVHRVGFASRWRVATRAVGAPEAFVFGQRVTTAIGDQVIRQDDGQLIIWHGHRTTGLAVNDWDGRAPITLA